MTKQRTCVGFQETEQNCKNKAGTRWTPYLGEAFDKRRRAYLDKALNAIAKHYDLAPE